jgi:hypothetical protein
MRRQIEIPKTTYDEYRTTTYDPAAKITLGNKLTASEDEVSSWKKNIKISPMDYKPLQGRSQLDSFKRQPLPPLNLMDSITSLT